MTRDRRLRNAWLASLLALVCASAPAQSRDASKTQRNDLEFEAWSKEWLDLDLDGSRKAWVEVVKATKEVRLRNLAFNRFVQLARMSGDFASIRRATRELAGNPSLTARERMTLLSYLRTIDRNRAGVTRVMKKLLSDYETARKKATTPEGRGRARATFFANLERAATTSRRPLGALLLNPARVPMRNTVLRANSNRGIPRDLVARTEQLVTLEREIVSLRKRNPKSADLKRLTTRRNRLRTDLRARATRVLRGYRADMRDFQREGNHGAVESLVDIVLDLERVLWPSGRRRLPMRQALRDPIARRGTLRKLRKTVEDRLEMVRGSDAAHAERLEAWLTTVKEQIRARRWNDAATATLEVLQADPFFFPR